ncbi:MAG: nuclear transport factor 2 family protein [Gammaproteobacteria bacterium]|jgi:ketosteroid isomerase-like protein|nr:nuclear transport factor 2 family protein [Gammaproteobacteria bacterium]
MLTPEQAQEFAREWIDAWNSHDLERILSHYEDDFEMSSPVIIQTMGEPSGRLKGKELVSVYWGRALARYPELHFDQKHVMVGVDSVTIIYNGVRGLSAEVFHFGVSGRVSSAFAHYGA